MANTIVNTLLTAGTVDSFHFALASDGTEETDLVIYDPGNYQAVPGTSTKIVSIAYANNSLTSFVKISWDADVDALCWTIPAAACGDVSFECLPSGILKPAVVSGLTGKLKLTTTGLATGDAFTLVISVRNTA